MQRRCELMDKKKKLLLVGGIVFIGIMLIFGLVMFSVLEPSVKIGYAGSNVGNKMSGSFKYFDGTESKTVKFNQGDIVTIKYSLEIEEGSLSLIVFDEKGNEVVKKSDNEGEVSFEVSETQKYKISIVAVKAKGKFNVKWDT